MQEREVDVVIIGAGPAGASCALSLRHYADAEVLILDKDNLQQLRVGEHVSASIFDFLDYLKVDRNAFSEHCFSANYGSTSYWGSDSANAHNSMFTTAGDSYQLQREEFDLTLLAQFVKAGGHVLPRTRCIRFTQDENHHWQIEIDHINQGKMLIKAKFLVDASGRSAGLSQQLGIKRDKVDNLAGVGAFMTLPHELPHDQLIETCEFGWWYSARLSEKATVATFFSDADIISKHQLHKTDNWNQLLSQTKHMRQRLSGAVSDTTRLWLKPAHSQTNFAHTIDNFLAVGDAAAAFDPISSMGVGFALTSGCYGAKAIKKAMQTNNNSALVQFSNDIHSNFNEYKQTHNKIYLQEQRFPDAAFWQRRHLSSNTLRS